MARLRQPTGRADGEGDDDAFVRAALLEAIENQLRNNDPPITTTTFQRLQGEGYGREEALDLIVFALSAEIWAIETFKRRFDLAHYTTLLESLPGLANEPEPETGEASS